MMTATLMAYSGHKESSEINVENYQRKLTKSCAFTVGQKLQVFTQSEAQSIRVTSVPEPTYRSMVMHWLLLGKTARAPFGLD